MTSVLPLPVPLQHSRQAIHTIAIAPFTYANLSLNEAMLDLGVRFVLNCPQEDISTSSRLMFQVEEAHWFYEDFAREQNANFPSLELPGFIKSLFKELPVLKSLCEDYEQAYAEFKEYKKGIPVRGAIIFNDKYDKVLMVRPWKRQTWGFPRGKINKEEDDKVCAVREVMEETGFDCSPYLDGDFYAERTIIGKNFRFYFAGGVPESTIFETRTRKEIDEIKWIPISELKNKHSRKKFFLFTQFIKPIEKFSRSKRGYSTDLSQKESNALKSILGVSNSPDQTIKNDAESAQQLLAMLRPSVAPDDITEPSVVDTSTSASQERRHETASPSVPPTNADRQILLNLLKESTPVSAENEENLEQNQVEGAKQILALLKREMSTQTSQSSTIDLNSHLPDLKESPVSAPMLPPNSMLEQLVSSRKLHASSRPTTVPRRRENISRNRLLDILHSSTGPQTRLIDLLAPPKTDSHATSPYSSSYELSRSNPLISLLDEEDTRMQESPVNKQPEFKDAEPLDQGRTSTSTNDMGGNALLSLLRAPSGANDTGSLFLQHEGETRTTSYLSDKDVSDKDVSAKSPVAADHAPVSEPAGPRPPRRSVRNAVKNPENRTASRSTVENPKGNHRALQSASSLKQIPARAPKLYPRSDQKSSGLSFEESELLDRLSEDAYYDPESSQETEKLHSGSDFANHDQASSETATLDSSIGAKKSHKDANHQGEKKQRKPASQSGKNNKSKNEKQLQTKQPQAKQSHTKSQQVKQTQAKQRLDEFQPSSPHDPKNRKEVSTEPASNESSPAQQSSDRSFRSILAGNPLLSLLSGKSRSAQPAPQQESIKTPILKQSPGGSLLDLLKLD